MGEARSASPQDLRVALIQADTVWHDAKANHRLYSELALAIERPCDLIALPETFSSGFTLESAQCAESEDGQSMAWMRTLAERTDAVVAGSMILRKHDGCYNSLVWMRPDGSHDIYDKRHLFRMAEENRRYRHGARKIYPTLRGWKLCPLICYDLRFPVWSRNRFDPTTGAFDYDALIYAANWPAARHFAWQTLLKARAIENQAYCLGINRVGTDGNGLHYKGESVALDYVGEALALGDDRARVVTATLSYDKLREFRRSFPAYLDADAFVLS